MAAGALAPIIRITALNDGEPVPGALLYTRLSGTSTPQATYTDAALSVPHENPVEADAEGVFPTIYLAAVAYQMEMTDADGNVLITPTDNIYDFAQLAFAAGIASNLFPSGSRTLGTAAAFWAKAYLTALILGAETTSGIRLEVNSGICDVREGDDSALAPLRSLTLEASTSVTAATATISGAGITLSNADPSTGIIANGAVNANLRLAANGGMSLRIDANGDASGEAYSWLHNTADLLMTLNESKQLLLGTATATNMGTLGDARLAGALWIGDGITAPTEQTGFAVIYVDTADGDLKVKFADGITKVLAADT